MNDQSPRRQFQLPLRTLLFVVTLLAVLFGYVGWQAKLVADRRRLRDTLIAAGDKVTANPPAKIGLTPPPLPQPIWLRSLLGDEPAGFIVITHEGTNAELVQAVESAFPEAVVLDRSKPGD